MLERIHESSSFIDAYDGRTRRNRRLFYLPRIGKNSTNGTDSEGFEHYYFDGNRNDSPDINRLDS